MPTTDSQFTIQNNSVPSTQWPTLSCSAANQLTLGSASLTLEGNREIFFLGNGRLRVSGDLRILTGNPATENLTILANGNVGIGETNPAAKLVVNGTLSLQQGVAINEFSVDGNLADNSDLAVPTEKAVKTALSTKADKSGSLTQDFQAKNITTQGNLQVTGTVAANKFVGDGSSLTGLLGATQWVNGVGGTISYSGGNVGIGTTSPIQRLQVTGNAIINNTFLGDVGHGVIWAGFSHSNSANTAGYALLQRNDGLFTLMNKKSGGGYLGFRVDNIDKMVITDNGNVGIGTYEPKAPLHIYSNGTPPVLRIQSAASFGSGRIEFWSNLQGNQPAFMSSVIKFTSTAPAYNGGIQFRVNWPESPFSGPTAEVMRLEFRKVSVLGVIQESSSRSLKENISELSCKEALITLNQLNPVKFSYKTDQTHEQHLGFIAEDVPELVASSDRSGLRAMDIVAVLTKAMQEQQATIVTLTQRLSTLEAKHRHGDFPGSLEH